MPDSTDINQESSTAIPVHDGEEFAKFHKSYVTNQQKKRVIQIKLRVPIFIVGDSKYKGRHRVQPIQAKSKELQANTISKVQFA